MNLYSATFYWGEGGAAKMSPPILKRLGIEKENFQIK